MLAYVMFMLMSLFAGLTALAVDVGHMYGLQNELQNAADACALAAAQQLATGNKDSATNGLSAARAVTDTNKSYFHGNQPTSYSILFSTSASSTSWLAAASISPSATNYRYARCTLTRNSMPRWFSYTRLGTRYLAVKAEAMAWRPASSYTGNNCGFAPGSCSQAASLVQ